MSSGVPSRPSGTACASASIEPGAAERGVAAVSIGASITPGATQFTVMPSEASSRAIALVKPRIADFDEI